MAQKFLTNVELEAGLVDGGNSTGTSGFLLSSTGTATSWVDPAAVSVGESEQVHIACKNTSGVAISKGDPVYITGTVGTSFIIQIAKADASVPTKMPAVGLAETDLGLNDEGFVIVSGVLKNLTTDPLSTSDGTPSSNDTVYVKAGGGLTKTKPTGSGNLIQNVGKVGRVSSANAGSLAVSTIMRTNDVPNLTTGKIWVGSPTYTTESTVVHLDETNGRMGIGTASPNDLFEIKSTTIPSIRLNSTDTTFPTFGSIKAYNNTTYRGELSWANNPVQDGAKITYIGFPSGSQTTGTFEVGANFVDTSINNGSMVTRLTTTGLGIGTTSPAQKLHVAGNVEIDGEIHINDTSTKILEGSSNSVRVQTASGYVEIGPHNTSYSHFYTDRGKFYFNAPIIVDTGIFATYNEAMQLQAPYGSTRMYIDNSSGNVGIGTTSPGAKLDIVSGDIRLGANATYFRVRDTASAQPRVLGMNSANTFYIGPIDSYAGGAIAYGVSGNVTYHGFYGGGGEKVRITSGGQVGVGLTAPQTALQLYGTADDTTVGGAHRTAIRLTSTYASTFGGGGELQFGLAPSTAGRDALSVVKGAYSAYSSGNYGGDLEFHTRDADGLGLKQRMTIAHDGNVGINTTNPGATLEVVGRVSNTEAAFKVTDDGDRFFEVVPDFSTTFRLGDIDGLGDEPVIIGGLSDLKFDVSGSTTMILDNNNRVGIGTTSPDSKLEVASTDTNTYLHVRNDSTGSTRLKMSNSSDTNSNGFQIINNASNGQVNLLNYKASTLAFWTNNLQRMAILSDGNVGIGTASPGEKLEVNGTVKATADTDAYKGYIKSVITTGYSMKSASTSYQYIPYNSYTLTTLQAYYNRTVAAYNGRVKKIIVKRIDGASADATGMKFKKEINGTVNATEYTATVLYGSGNFQATYNFANSDFTFSAGDSIGVLMQSSGGTGMIGAGAIQIVLEYNIT